MSNAWKLVEAVVDTPSNEEKNDGKLLSLLFKLTVCINGNFY